MKRLLFFMIVSLWMFECALAQSTWAEQTLSQLSLDEKIGQLLMIDVQASKFEASEAYRVFTKKLITDYHVGSIIVFKNSPEKQVSMTNKLQAIAKYPLLIGQDCEWGLSMRLENTVRFPKNMTLGAIQNESVIYDVGKEIGKHCRAIGVHINFAPVLDINSNPDNPIIGVRSFGSDKYAVARKSILFSQGLEAGAVLACAKHFPGHGDTSVDSHKDLPVISHTYDRLMLEELYPFTELIQAGVSAVMTAHLSIPALDQTANQPSTLSHKIVTDLLRKKLNFNGLIVTDAMNMKGVSNFYTPGQASLKALLAGNDLIIMPLDVPEVIKSIKQALADSVMTVQELDEHVMRVLQAKERVGIHENRFVNETSMRSVIDSEYARKLKRELYEQAITVVRDEQHLLPIKNSKRVGIVHVGGHHDEQLDAISASYLQISPTPTAKEITLVMEMLDEYEEIVVVLYAIDKSMGFFGRVDSISEQLEHILERMILSHKKICVLACMSPYCLKFLKHLKTVVMAYENDFDAYQAALRVIFGNITPTGKLPIVI